MSMAAVAITTGAVTAGASIYSSNKASKAQRAAADKASATELEMFYASQDAQKPWRDVGGNALNELAYRLGIDGKGSEMPAQSITNIYKEYLGRDPDEGGLQNYLQHYNQGMSLADIERNIASSEESQRLLQQGRIEPRTTALYANATRGGTGGEQGASGNLLANFTEKDFWDDPVTKLGFQFGMDEGTKGLNRQLSSIGGLNSGAALKALTRFGNDYASTKGSESFNRFNVNQDKTFNRLASLAGVGQQASQQMGSQAMATGQSIGNNIMGAGNARAASYIGTSNAITDGVGQGVNWWQQQQRLNKSPSNPTYMTPSGGIDYTKNGWWDVNSFGAP